jgi:predicted ABC-class ATPase
LRFIPQGQVPDEAHEDGTAVIVSEEHRPQHLHELRTQLGLLELPCHRCHSVGDEQIAEGPRLAGESSLEQVELVVEGLDGLRSLQHLNLSTAAFQRAACLEVPLQVLRTRRLIV